MLNVTTPPLSYFILGAFMNVGSLKFFYLLLTLILYILIIAANTFLIVVICVNRSLHEPMYMFLCSLFVNELYGSTGLFPLLMLQILSDVHTVSAPLCFLQIFCIHTYGSVEVSNLAIMSYDRYLAICCPLQQGSPISVHEGHGVPAGFRLVIFIVVIWLYSFVKFTITLCLTLRLTWCGKIINGLYCHNYLVVKLACSDTNLNNLFGLFGTVITVLVPLLPIFYSYMKILKVCFSGSREMRCKAVSTCAPHLASLLNFSFGCLFEILQSRFDTTSVPSALRIFLSLYFLIIQPLLNPIMYGTQMSKIRHVLCYKM
uniref:Olfactory receptor n=1 Tax=Oreochromis aureus TaxID=47969 RepID=A0A668SIR1_OREAU